MYLPSFIVGPILKRTGSLPLMGFGVSMNGVGISLLLTSDSYWNFVLSLTLVGIGWAFGFIASTALLTNTYRPNEKAAAQGVNDCLLYFVLTLGIGTTGPIVGSIGWEPFLVGLLGLLFLNLMGLAATALSPSMRAASQPLSRQLPPIEISSTVQAAKSTNSL